MNIVSKSKKCSDTQKGRVVIHKGDTEKRIYNYELDEYLKNGWCVGISESHRKANSESHKGKPAPNKNKPCKDDTKIKISNSLKGNVPWNCGLTADEDDRVKNNIISSTQTKIAKYGSAFPNNNMDDKHKLKISNSLSGKKRGKMDEKKLKIKLTKEYLTKKKNKSFNTSKAEEQLYESLLKEHETKTIYRNYNLDDRYPYYCDFYILEDDLFIELNAHWTHGGKPFNPKDKECIDKLHEWEEKAKTSKYYAEAIITWTIRDVEKAKCAQKNNLNYKVIY